MQKLEKTISSYINTAIGYSILMVILGMIFLIFPDTSLDAIRWILAIGLMALGFFMFVNDLSRRSAAFSGGIGGVLLFVLGLVIAMYPAVMDIIPIVLGAWMIASSVFSLRLAGSIRSNSSFFASTVMPVVTLACGILLIARPGAGNIALMVYVGIMLIIYAVASLVNLFTIRSRLDAVSKFFKDGGKYIDIEVESEKKTKK